MARDRRDDDRRKPRQIGAKARPLGPPLKPLGEDEEKTVVDSVLQRKLAGNTRRDTTGPYAVPTGWGFHELSLRDYWTRVLDLQRAQLDGPEALGLALSAYDLEDFAHLDWLRERFERRYGKDPDFEKAKVEAREGRAARPSRKR